MSRPRRDPEAILRRLEWTVIRRLDGILYGDYRTLFRGLGLDLADLREYQLHDDVRHIDWNVTARMQVPHVREYNEDREIAAWFLLDVSPSVGFGSEGLEKREVLVEFVGLLGRLLTRNGNRVGTMLYDRSVNAVIPPRAGRIQVLRMLARLQRAMDQASPGREQTRLGDLLEFAGRAIPRRSLVFVISDFISEPGWARPLRLLSERHETLAIRLFDPLEVELPDLGLLTMEDSETGEQLLVDTHDRSFRLRFAAAARRREQALRAAFRQAGVDALEVSTSGDPVDVILRFADLRKSRSQLAASRRAPTHMGTDPP